MKTTDLEKLDFYTEEDMLKIAQLTPLSVIDLRNIAAFIFIYLSGMRITAFLSMPIFSVHLEDGFVVQNPSDGTYTKLNKAGNTVLLDNPILLEVVKRWDTLVQNYCPPDSTWYARMNNRQQFNPKIIHIGRRENGMETDRRVYQYLAANLSGRSRDIVDRYSKRIAVFSDLPERLDIGEIKLKSKLWDYLDEAIAGGITTLYTGLSYGADSAAAELFAVRKQQNRDIRIVHITASQDWLSGTDPALRGFAANTLRNNIDYTRTVSSKTPEKARMARDRFIIDQCLHIVLLADLSGSSEESYVWQLLDYAVTPRNNSISHQIHIISCRDVQQMQREPQKKCEPVQGSLF